MSTDRQFGAGGVRVQQVGAAAHQVVPFLLAGVIVLEPGFDVDVVVPAIVSDCALPAMSPPGCGVRLVARAQGQAGR